MNLFIRSMSCAAILAVAVLALAQTAPTTVTGTVVSRNGDKLTISTDTGDLTFTIAPSVSTSQYSTLEPGQRVEVSQQVDTASSDRIATDIRLVSDAGSSGPAPSTPDQTSTSQVGAGSSAPSSTSGSATESARQLPATASPGGLLALLGVAAISLAGALRHQARTQNH